MLGTAVFLPGVHGVAVLTDASTPDERPSHEHGRNRPCGKKTCEEIFGFLSHWSASNQLTAPQTNATIADNVFSILAYHISEWTSVGLGLAPLSNGALQRTVSGWGSNRGHLLTRILRPPFFGQLKQ